VGKLPISTLQWSDNFLASNFSVFSTFSKSKFFDTVKLGENKVLRKHFYETTKPNLQETAHHLKSVFYIRCLDIFFLTYIHENLFH
jgi:hypothetical protein